MPNIAAMPLLRNILSIGAVIFFLSGCTESERNKPADTLGSGNISISVDETYRPIMQQQMSVFDSSFPDAHVTVNYKPESDCIREFLNDSTRLILVTRELSADEKQLLEGKKVVSTSLALAKDAIAIVLNKSNPDSVLSLSTIKGILTGKYNKNYTVVFDNQGSSTVRYMLDSLIPGEKLGTNVFAAKGNDSVISYVMKNENAVGFVGVSYVSDYNDPEGLAFINTVKVAEVYNDSLKKSYGPYQVFIANNRYPLTRNLFVIHRETYPGLATGLTNFLSKERGQLIYKQARLFPLRSNIIFREAEINE